MSRLKLLLLVVIVGASLFRVAENNDKGIFYVMSGIVGLLLFFSLTWRLMANQKNPMAEEIRQRTQTWWWMVAIFMLALAFHRIVSFAFLGFLCFAALREFFSLLPMSESKDGKALTFKDRPSIFICYASIPLMIIVAYVKWYELFVILIPVYVFLLIPILFVLQNRTEGSIKSIGIVSLGLMFFAHNLGHCLFMINLGPMLLLYCFVLTEVRDLLSFWVGKLLARISSEMNDGWLKQALLTKVASAISPQKTWATGLVSALMTAMLSLAFVPLMPTFPDGRLSYTYSLIVGFGIGIAGLFGDLVFSMVKRDLNSKDSGTLLPGHGGIIDRVDSLVFTIPLTFHLISWMYY